MFINISNHPSTKWSTEQLEAARKLTADRKVTDLPFPQVDPEVPEIEQLAETLVNKVLDIAETSPVIVHIMGETGLTFAVVTRLKYHGIRTVYSTTKREVVEKVKEDGSVEKTTVFKFVRFREY